MLGNGGLQVPDRRVGETPPSSGSAESKPEPFPAHEEESTSIVEVAGSRYRLIGQIGWGRLGPIFAASDADEAGPAERGSLAVQRLEPRLASNFEYFKRLKRGVAAIAAAPHENLIDVFGLYRYRGRILLPMELLDGASLRVVLRDASTLPLEETRAVVRAVGDALSYLHAKSIVHGRVQPETVFVTSELRVKLIDIVPLPSAALVPGEAGERASAAGSGVGDDEFGLACLAYELLAGRHPYNYNTQAEAYRAGLELTRLPGLSDGEWSALDRALALDPDRRYGSVASFMAAFGITGQESLRALPERPATMLPAPGSRPELSGEDAADDRDTGVPVVADVVADVGAGAGAGAGADVGAAVLPAEEAAIVTPVRTAPTRAGRRFRPFRHGTALLLLAALAGVTWRYYDPLRAMTTDLIETVRLVASTATAGGASEGNQAAPAVTVAAGAGADDTGSDEAGSDEAGSDGAVADEAGSDGAVADTGPAAGPAPEPAAQAVTPEPIGVRPVAEPGESVDDPAAASPGQPDPPAARIPAPTAASGSPVPVTEPTFAFALAATAVGESAGAARIVVERAGDLSVPAAVSWWTEDMTAVADEDYADLGLRVERFAAAESSATLFVPLIDDGLPETAERFAVIIGPEGSRGAPDEAIAQIIVEIVDDD